MLRNCESRSSGVRDHRRGRDGGVRGPFAFGERDMRERRVSSGWKRVRWTKAMCADFFDTLAETCNVAVSAEAAGVRPQSVYYRRRVNADFAAAWREALIAGYETLETRLVGLALARLDGSAAATIDNGPHGAIDTDLALRMLTQHRNALGGKVRGGHPPLRRVTPAEAARALMARLDAYEKRLGLPPLTEAHLLPAPAA